MSRYLDMIDGPAHVKKLTLPQLHQLAEEIRYELITKLSKNGGHLGPNLGVVELTMALHYVFTTPKDKFVWDVSHQIYVHKILTGRKDRFHTIRTTDGLNGFALRTESEHDCYGAGHAGTALSAALGMCAARDQRGTDEQIISIFGDAALTNGISFEGLNNISTTTKKFIGILNDNEWSIAKNVGAIASYLNKLITNPRYNRLQKDFERWLRRMPKGDLAIKLGHKAEEAFKGAVNDITLQQNPASTESDGRGGFGSSLIFEEMGLRYLGPIDGHDLPLLINCLEFAKTCDHPVVLHVLTKKGKGYDVAIQQPEKFHGTGPYDVQTGASPAAKPGVAPAWQDVFGQTMVKLCQNNNNIVGITAAMPSGTGLKFLEKAMPQKYYDVGIAEEHAVLFAAGMATMGFHPVCAIYSTFLQRSYDIIIHDVALQDLPVIFCMDRAGLSPQDGPTHHGLFDISYLRCVPNIIAMAPKDEDELVDMMFTATHQNHPTFIRYPRGAGEGVPIKDQPRMLEIGKAEVIQNFFNTGGRKVALFGLGNMMSVARKAAMELTAEGFDVAIVNPRFTKPIDAGTTEFYGRAADLVVTLEDHVLPGGYGSSVLELFSEKQIQTPVVRIGWPDKFIEHASSVEYLREKHGLTVPSTVAQVKAHFATAVEVSATKFPVVA
ncbi:1-deoxy-D-xylulose-5-phosphate synthase [Pedosphaera parvula]|uniref:1-deoxy-D-xylulose-5-phosphate synthase n=1 Tax=Pedosphaera parvula (strain Ellin514) TaxID=320771 RepID=B9XJ04_PEDPL|nr:1-deoxy-D-xylulose-5-phosphate synthase [Pedosphaera parvula]EEF60231.1 deoxyxylulose-5-phosphate synthase [Pedosphaera parvula Ellin514]